MLGLLLSPVYILLNIYIARWLMRWMAACYPVLKRRGIQVPVLILYIFLASTILTSYLIPAGPVHRFLKITANYFLGTFAYILLAILIFDLLRLILKRTLRKRASRLNPRRLFAVTGGATILLIAGVSVYGILHMQDIRVRSHDLTVGKSCAVEELRVALVSDLHLGYTVGRKQMRQMVDKINAQRPDLVCLAGDIFDNEYEAIDRPEEIARILKGIDSRLGVFACEGNHDIREKTLAGFTFRGDAATRTDERFTAFLDKAGIRLLRDETVLLDNAIYLSGRKDPSKCRKTGETRLTPEELTASLDKTRPILVMDHQPRELQELADAGADVDLSGHTHNGQLFPGNWLVGAVWENPAGWLRVDRMISCVTSGVGVWGPGMRVGTDSEIMMLAIRFSAD